MTGTTEDLSSIEEGYKVAVLFDVTGRGDKSFNDAAAAGLDKAATDFGVDPTESTPSGDADRAARLDTAVQGGNQLVVAVGFLWTDTVGAAAPANPDTKFAIVDSVVEADNVASLVFAEEQGSFLVGAAAALKSQTGTIGFVGGVPIDLIKKFEAGYTAGARAVNPDIEVIPQYISEDPSIGFNDDAKGQELAAAMYEADADIIYHAAGASGLGVFEAAAAAGEPGEVWAIGVDSDQYQSVDADLQPYILTSMLKRVDVAVYETSKAAASDTFAGGVQVFDLSVDGVGYSTSGGNIDDIVPQLEDFKQQIIAGEIDVPTVPES
ncbi:MAG: BMP family ABC transporter substrate-binding protein [Actinomycetota bacterium]|nr:BMP family ABC transporter substrate-binding protein [Actinomycetota bacterium]